MYRKLVLLILILQLLCVTHRALGSQAADDLRAKLAKRVTNYNLGVFNLPEALIRVSADFKLPMGIVWVDTPATNAELPFAWKDRSVQKIIDAIAKGYPGYQLQVRNGVVHVFPSSAIPDRQNFLKLKVSAFQTHNAMIEVASFKLHMLVTPIRGSYQMSVAGPGDSEVTVDLKNSTVEDVLDALVVASNRKICIVTFTDDSRLTSKGFRRTRSLFTNAPIPDENEPVWHLLRWEDPMPRVVSVTK